MSDSRPEQAAPPAAPDPPGPPLDDVPPLPPSPPDLHAPETVFDPVPVLDEPPPETRGRAGRDLPAAIAVGLGLAGLVLGSLFVRPAAFVVLVAVAVVVGVWELTRALDARGVAVPVPPVLLGGLAMLVAGYLGGAQALGVALALTVLAVLLWRSAEGPEHFLRDAAAGVFAAVYVPFLAGFAVLMLAAEDGPQRIVVFVLATVASDIGGYAAGVLLGRHPMAPSVSPKKSWEGFAGSVLLCVVAGTAAGTGLLGLSWWQGALLGLACVLTATLGDLGESLVKRDLGIKDMGSVLPGHGGMLDRLDSLLPTAPVAYLLLAAFTGSG